jgi:hypothetical protein
MFATETGAVYEIYYSDNGDTIALQKIVAPDDKTA